MTKKLHVSYTTFVIDNGECTITLPGMDLYRALCTRRNVLNHIMQGLIIDGEIVPEEDKNSLERYNTAIETILEVYDVQEFNSDGV